MSTETIETLLDEERRFPPPAGFTEKANVRDEAIYEEGEDIESFWEGHAKTFTWFEQWNQVLDWNLPLAKWFVDGKTNITVNCIDRHIANGLGDKVAYIWEGEPGDQRVITYADLLKDVKEASAGGADHALPDTPPLAGHNLRAYIGELEEKMRKAAADLEFEEAARLRDEIRKLEEDELGIPDADRAAPRVGYSHAGKPGTRKNRFGKTRYKKMGGRP